MTARAVISTLDQAFDGGKIIDGADSEANSVQIGEATEKIKLWHDGSAGHISLTTGALDFGSTDLITTGDLRISSGGDQYSLFGPAPSGPSIANASDTLVVVKSSTTIGTIRPLLSVAEYTGSSTKNTDSFGSSSFFYYYGTGDSVANTNCGVVGSRQALRCATPTVSPPGPTITLGGGCAAYAQIQPAANDVTITNAYAFLAEGNRINDATSEITTSYNFFGRNFDGQAGTLTNNWGFFQEELTQGTQNVEFGVAGAGIYACRVAKGTQPTEYMNSVGVGYLDLHGSTAIRPNADVHITKVDPAIKLYDTGDNEYAEFYRTDTDMLAGIRARVSKPGGLAYALTLADAANNVIKTPSFAFDNSNNALTFRCIMNVGGKTAAYHTLLNSGTATDHYILWLYQIDATTGYMRFTGGGYDVNWSTSPYGADFDKTKHIVLVADFTAKTAVFYVDGVSQGSKSLGAAPQFPDTDQVKYIGSYQTASHRMVGTIDAPAVWYEAKDQAWVTADYSGGVYTHTTAESNLEFCYNLNKGSGSGAGNLDDESDNERDGENGSDATWATGYVPSAASTVLRNAFYIQSGVTASEGYKLYLGDSNQDGTIYLNDDLFAQTAIKIQFRDSAIGIYSQADTYMDLFADGGIRIGDSSAGAPTNYTNFAPDGLMTMAGTARVKRQEWIQAEAVRAPLANPATFTDLGISGVWEFADNLTKIVIAKLPLITDIDTSEDVTIYIGWSSPTTSAVCAWQVEYLVRAEDEDMSAVAEATLQQDETSSATANGLVISSFTIAAANIADTDSCLLLRISRLGADGDDTLGDVANLHGICLHYTSNKLGTAT